MRLLRFRLLLPMIVGLLMMGQGMERIAFSQILDVSGGASSMYQSEGGSVVVRGTHYESGISAGTVGGHLLAGAHVAYGEGVTHYLLGMEQVPLDLPTDILGGGHRMIGLGADIKTVRWGTTAEIFAGTTSTRYESPLVQAAKPNDPVAALLLRRSLTSTISLSTQMLFSPETRTILQSIAWKARPSLHFALTGGTGAGKPYAAGSVLVKRPKLDLSAAYIQAGAGFRRTGSQIDPTAESVRENLLFTLRSSSSTPRFTLSGGRQNLMALPFSSTQSTASASTAGDIPTVAAVDELSGFMKLSQAGLSASVLHSTYRGQTNVGLVASANLPVNRQITMGASYFESRLMGTAITHAPVRFGLGHFQEVLTNRWTATETVTISGAQTTTGFGGTFLSNFTTISTDYETFYLPTRPENPFQQSLVLDVGFNLFGRLHLHGGSFVSPQGRLSYTVDAHGVFARRGTFLPVVEQANLSRFVIAGNVVDQEGGAVEGAAIQIEGQVLFTNAGGRFIFREKKEGTHELNVLVDRFLDGEAYSVVTKGQTAKSSEAALRLPLIIVVARGKQNVSPDGKLIEKPKP